MYLKKKTNLIHTNVNKYNIKGSKVKKKRSLFLFIIHLIRKKKKKTKQKASRINQFKLLNLSQLIKPTSEHREIIFYTKKKINIKGMQSTGINYNFDIRHIIIHSVKVINFQKKKINYLLCQGNISNRHQKNCLQFS